MPHNDLVAHIDPKIIYALAALGAYFALYAAWKTLKFLWRKTRAFFRNVAAMERDEDDALSDQGERAEAEYRERRVPFDDGSEIYLHVADDRHP